MQNLAGKVSERDANRVDSPNHVQNTQHSSGTERLVALQHEESEDSTLIHRPHDEVSNILQTQVLQNISRKFDVSIHLLHMFPSEPVSLGDIHEFVYVGSHVPQQIRRGRHTRHPEYGMTKIETIFETAQAQISNLTNRDHENPRT